MRTRRWLPGCAALMLALSGCNSGGSRSAVPDGPGTADRAMPSAAAVAPGGLTASIKNGGPLVALPSCQPAPEGIEADVPGLLLPQGAVVTEVQDQGPLISVRGYIEQTPIQVRQFYQQAEGLELFEIEDEVYEAEVLFAGPQFRSYVKAQAQCQQGSVLIVFVGPGDSGALPSVGGG